MRVYLIFLLCVISIAAAANRRKTTLKTNQMRSTVSIAIARKPTRKPYKGKTNRIPHKLSSTNRRQTRLGPPKKNRYQRQATVEPHQHILIKRYGIRECEFYNASSCDFRKASCDGSDVSGKYFFREDGKGCFKDGTKVENELCATKLDESLRYAFLESKAQHCIPIWVLPTDTNMEFYRTPEECIKDKHAVATLRLCNNPKMQVKYNVGDSKCPENTFETCEELHAQFFHHNRKDEEQTTKSIGAYDFLSCEFDGRDLNKCKRSSSKVNVVCPKKQTLKVLDRKLYVAVLKDCKNSSTIHYIISKPGTCRKRFAKCEYIWEEQYLKRYPNYHLKRPTVSGYYKCDNFGSCSRQLLYNTVCYGEDSLTLTTMAPAKSYVKSYPLCNNANQLVYRITNFCDVSSNNCHYMNAQQAIVESSKSRNMQALHCSPEKDYCEYADDSKHATTFCKDKAQIDELLMVPLSEYNYCIMKDALKMYKKEPYCSEYAENCKKYSLKKAEEMLRERGIEETLSFFHCFNDDLPPNCVKVSDSRVANMVCDIQDVINSS